MTAASLVALSGSVSDAEFETDLASWLRGRDPDRAAREILAFAAFGGSQDRVDAVRVAGRLGTVTLRAWRDAMQRPEMRGYARIALAQMAANPAVGGVGPLPEPAPDDMNWLATDFLAVAYANGEGLDKATAALAKHAKEDPAVGEGFGAMLETKDHRDQLARITGFQHK